jgi:Flp pilus assembly CpaE family ATPase
MQDKISFAVLSPNEASRAAIAQGLAATGLIRVVTDAARPEELETTLQNAARVGVYVDVSDDPDKALGWIEALTEPKPPVLAGGPADPQIILRAMRAGALAYFPEHDFCEELGRVASRLQAQVAAEAPPKQGQVLAVLGVKGGVGCTTIACELAASLAAGGGEVVLVDAKAYFGDVALHLDVTPAYTLAEVAAQAGDLDGTFLSTVAHRHEASGVHVVAAPSSPEEADGIDANLIDRSIELLRGEFDWVVVDMPRITDEATLLIIDKADQVVVVTTPEVPALVRARQHLSLLDQLGVSEDKRHVVANSATRPGLLSDEDPVKAVGIQAVAYVPHDDVTMQASLATGKPASVTGGPKCKVAPVFADLARQAHEWCGVEKAEKEGRTQPEDLKGRVQNLVKELRCRLATA